MVRHPGLTIGELVLGHAGSPVTDWVGIHQVVAELFIASTFIAAFGGVIERIPVGIVAFHRGGTDPCSDRFRGPRFRRIVGCRLR